MTLFQRLDPRLHLAAAIGWAVVAVVTLAALVSANLAAALAEQQARADAEGLLGEVATQVRDALSMNLELRRSLLQATAAQIAAAVDRSPGAMGKVLDTVQGQYPEFTRLVVVNPQGQRVVDTRHIPAAGDVLAEPWFPDARLRPVVSDLHAVAARRRRVVDLAVPLRLGDNAAVLAAEVDWGWVERLITKMQVALNTHRQLELMLLSRDGVVLVGADAWLGRRLEPGDDVSEGGSQVVVRRTQLRLADSLGFGWTAIVRQPAEQALATARMTRRNVLVIVFVAGLLSAAGAMVVTRLLTRRLTLLAVDAEAVRRGERRNLALPSGHDEIGRIGATLAQVVDHLQAEKQLLQGLNAELDRRVAERTSRIGQMADEARQAAVTRERLRLARDLHDTLAHSLMALLTQIRLVRKLHGRMDGAELEDELGRAEAVAATGLAEARGAISQMRDNGVRDTGLGPALHDLARRFQQRSGVALVLDDQAHGLAPLLAWADDRAETVFRIVAEALRNVERHAQASGVTIRLSCSAAPVQGTGAGAPAGAVTGAATRAVTGVATGGAASVAAGAAVGVAASAVAAAQLASIEVTDDGIGFDTGLPRPGHFGLRGMHEHAELIDAALTVQSQPGHGTRIGLTVQL